MNTIEAQFAKYNAKTPLFSLAGFDTFSRVVGVHDGDSVTAIIPVNNSYYRYPIRLDGIDTCEIKAVSPENCALAQKARDRLFTLITGQVMNHDDHDKYLNDHIVLVRLICGKNDKYGRVLGKIYSTFDDKRTLNDKMLDEKLAYSYHGKKKLTEAEQIALLV
jgi:endonuclease YncB( thermonuclease family)